MPWFRALSAEDRSWIGLIAGRHPAFVDVVPQEPDDADAAVTAEVFGTAPRELPASSPSSRPSRWCGDDRGRRGERRRGRRRRRRRRGARGDRCATPARSRSPTAEVYARAAEQRGAWDARLEALVVDSVLRGEADEAVRSRASALGWDGQRRRRASCSGARPTGDAPARESIIDDVRRSARARRPRRARAPSRATGWSSCSAASTTPTRPAQRGRGPLRRRAGRDRTGRRRTCCGASVSARAAIAGLRAAPGWPDAPAPGVERRPAPRARPGRRRPRPPRSWSTRSTGRSPRPGTGCWRR